MSVSHDIGREAGDYTAAATGSPPSNTSRRASLGFQEAARFLTENRKRFGASIDHVGLVVFFLQRHRMEIAMKELLVFAGAKVEGNHPLTLIWKDCEAAVGPSSDEWKELASLTELVQLIDKHDHSSHTFRYPVDRKDRPHERPAYIDLGALEKHVDDFVYAIRGYMDYVSEGKRNAES